MSRQSRGDGLEESEQKRQAEAYLKRRENRLKDEAEAYLGFDGSWGKDGD